MVTLLEEHLERRQKNPAAATLLFEVCGADLHAHAACNFAHRRKQRQGALTIADGLIGDANHLGIKKLVGENGNRSQVKVGEEYQAFAKEDVLLLDRLLDLDHDLGFAPDIAGIADDLCACILIARVSESGELARMGFDQHLVAGLR